ncbi:MAG: hypothetical protein GXY54_01495 [Deltaproteobacteria bacterium]|nr:hypothetical protein [Deltaproteobacteria bacterium]
MPGKFSFPLPFLAILMLFLIASCVGAPDKAQYVDPAFSERPLVILALLPITYAAGYDQPIEEPRLSRDVRHYVRRELTKKGYRVILTGPHYARGMAELISAEPARLAAMVEKEADGVVLIFVNFHAGIDFREYQAGEPFSYIDIYADARLITRENPRDLWRDEGRGSDFAAGPFYGGSPSLSRAVANLAGNLFATLPAQNLQNLQK